MVWLAGGAVPGGGGWGRHTSRRHERPGGAAPATTGAADERADWDALSRGDDPS
ncbi:Trp biosynthesis-associated membrane protein [Cellulomonas xiejunii]|uniref:Trp biosynthesis-associated membrane protein n=1 Tax=Cellulomonas xiejunii TaxID=2968083 RepID=UPI001D0F0DD3|nr:Trp biosynthesis-associated membrane protein [Cellulomonas xiejunii]